MIPVSVDLGNLAVGLGTALLAVVGYRTIRSSDRQHSSALEREAQQRAADFRMQWRERLRDETAELVKMHRQVSILRRNGAPEPEERLAVLEWREARARCEMLFGNEPNQSNDAAFLALIAAEIDPDYEIARSQREEIVRLARDILERQSRRVYEELLKT
jgi:hypothetical protein